MLICTFFGITDYFAAYPEISILYLRILDGYCHPGASLHVLILYTAFVCIDKNIFAVGAKPNRSYLRRTIGHDGCKIEQRFCFIFEEVKKISWKGHLPP